MNRQEWEKIKSLKGKKRLEYLWMYYRPVLYVLAVLILICCTLWTAVGNLRKETLLSVVIVDADRQAAERFDKLEAALLERLGTGSRKEEVSLDLSAVSREEDDSMMNMAMKLSVAEDNDAVILDEKTWERFRGQNIFADWEDVLGDDYPDYQEYVTGKDRLLLSGANAWEEGGYVRYSPAYLCVLEKSERKDRVKAFAEYWIGQLLSPQSGAIYFKDGRSSLRA